MNSKVVLLIMATIFLWSNFVNGQSFQIELGKLDIEKGKVYWIKTSKFASNTSVEQTYEVTVPFTVEVEKTETVEVPYTEQVEVNGKTKTIQKTKKVVRTVTVPVTKVRTEKRTRMVPVSTTVEKEETVLVSSAYKFSTIDGTEVSIVELKQSIRSGQRIVLVLPPGRKLNEWHRAALQPGMIVMKLPPSKDVPKK